VRGSERPAPLAGQRRTRPQLAKAFTALWLEEAIDARHAANSPSAAHQFPWTTP